MLCVILWQRSQLETVGKITESKMNGKSTRVYRLVNAFKETGTPIYSQKKSLSTVVGRTIEAKFYAGFC